MQLSKFTSFLRQEKPESALSPEYHKTLVRQIQKHLDISYLKKKKWHNLFKAISDTYIHFDEDRQLIERSLELSSNELNAANQELRQKVMMFDERSKELEKMNRFMLGRELRMAELKRELRQYQELLKEHDLDLPEKINQSPEM